MNVLRYVETIPVYRGALPVGSKGPSVVVTDGSVRLARNVDTLGDTYSEGITGSIFNKTIGVIAQYALRDWARDARPGDVIVVRDAFPYDDVCVLHYSVVRADGKCGWDVDNGISVEDVY